MAGKPWEKYAQTEPAAPAGPWEKYKSQSAEPLRIEDDTDPGALMAAADGAAHGVPVIGSYLDNISAAATRGAAHLIDAKNKVASTLGLQGERPSLADGVGSYTKLRDEYEQDTQDEQAKHPYAFTAGALASGLATGGMIGKAAGLISAPEKVAEMSRIEKLLEAANRIKKAGVLGAAMGALRNPGDTKGEVSGLQLGDRASNAAKDGAISAAGQGLAEGVAALPVGDKLASTAEEKAFKALGPYARQARQAYAKDQINTIGRELLDNGVVSAKPTSYAGIAERAANLKNNTGSEIGQVVEGLDQASPSAISRSDIANNLRQKLLKSGDIEGVDGDNETLQNLIKSFESREGDLGLAQAHDLKGKYDSEINWDRLPDADIPVKEQFYRGMRSELNNAVDAKGNEIAQSQGSDLADRLKALKQTYGAAKTAQNVADGREAREFANRFLSPSDYFTGAIGAGAGVATGHNWQERLEHGVMGFGLGLANKASRQYGNQVLASGLNAAGKALNTPDSTRLSTLLQAYRQLKGGANAPAFMQPNGPSDLRAQGADADREPSSGPGPQNHRYVNPNEAQDQFLKGNGSGE